MKRLKGLMMSEAADETEMAVPQMIGLNALTKIIVGYLKAGGQNQGVRGQDVAELADVAQNNVSINNKFLTSIGIIEVEARGSYKLTKAGVQYAQALDWGRLDEARNILAETIKNKPLVERTLSYVDINKPVSRDDLTGKIASIAGVANEDRFSVGIKGFVDMMISAGLLIEDSEGTITTQPKLPPKEQSVIPIARTSETKIHTTSVPVNITINLSDNIDEEKIRSVIRAIRDAMSEK